jgi:GNAT superfamily N-acetyltransferase
MNVELSLYNPALIYTGQKQFDCEHTVISSFVHNSLKPQVKKSLSVAYVLTDADEMNRFVGFYTIAQHMIDVALLSSLELGSLPRKTPCSRLVMLGIDKRYKGQNLASMLMKHALTVMRSIAKQMGSFGMYLDADPLALGFYQKLGFALLDENKAPEPSSMFLPLSSIGYEPSTEIVHKKIHRSS